MKILVATDGTATAIVAARKALGLLKGEPDILLATVVHDYEDPMEDAGGFEGPLLTPEEAEAEYQQQLAKGQAALEQTQTALGRPAQFRVIPAADDAGHAIVALARELQPDLIVLGSEHKGFFARLFTGSVSEYVTHHATCPVLVVPHQNSD